MKFLTLVFSPNRASSHREWLFPHGSRAQASPHSITQEWAQDTAPEEDASLSLKQPVLSPSSFQSVTVLEIPAIHLQSGSGMCSVTTGFHSFTQVQLLLRRWRHALHKQFHCAGPGTSAEISQWQMWCLFGRWWCQQQLLASSYASVQLWSFPFWQNCFTTKDLEKRCMEDKSQGAWAISDLFMSH